MLTRRDLAAAVVVATAGCHPAPPVRSTFQPGEPVAGESPPRVAGQPADPAELATRADMRRHFGLISDVKNAVIRGDLDRARRLARELEQRPTTPPADGSWTARTQSIHVAAKRVATATTLPAIAGATAALASQCGHCHVDLEAQVELPLPATPRTASGVDATMEVHRWAADRMWEGVVFPSDERWIRGTTMFVALPGCGRVPPETPADEMEPRCRQVQVVVRQGHDPPTLESRAHAYGQLLATCAGCHRGGESGRHR